MISEDVWKLKIYSSGPKSAGGMNMAMFVYWADLRRVFPV